MSPPAMAPPSMLDEVSVSSEPFPASSDAVIDLVDDKQDKSDDRGDEKDDRQEIIGGEEETSDETAGKKAPSNEYVLVIAFVSFLLFVIVQVGFSVIANSRSLLVDSEAMMVDAATYLFNFLAERYKRKSLERGQQQGRTTCEMCLAEEPDIDGAHVGHERQARAHDQLDDDARPQNLYLELIPPAVSVVALTVVTSLALSNAAATLVPSPGQPSAGPVNLTIVLAFSLANLLLDIVNVFCFSRIKRNIFGLENLNVCSAWTVRFCGPLSRLRSTCKSNPYISFLCAIPNCVN
jgi:hypothetical protein